jgi:diphthamide synthase (EF-2-diphthine--ammonia ligase)
MTTLSKLYIIIYNDNFKHEEHGFHPCGEGGEFESLTLDCPIYKKKIVMYKNY